MRPKLESVSVAKGTGGSARSNIVLDRTVSTFSGEDPDGFAALSPRGLSRALGRKVAGGRGIKDYGIGERL